MAFFVVNRYAHRASKASAPRRPALSARRNVLLSETVTLTGPAKQASPGDRRSAHGEIVYCQKPYGGDLESQPKKNRPSKITAEQSKRPPETGAQRTAELIIVLNRTGVTYNPSQKNYRPSRIPAKTVSPVKETGERNASAPRRPALSIKTRKKKNV